MLYRGLVAEAGDVEKVVGDPKHPYTRLLIGSEGILGVITQAWMRLQDRPKFRDGGAVRFKDFFSAARAVRAISQAGLYPSNCRILDPAEAYNSGAGDGLENASA